MPANFKNRTVWTGDNLDVLRGINSECVDLIYLDPPFNSNQDYAAPVGSEAAGAAFKDTWTRDDVDDAEHGLLADQEPALYNVIAASRDAHGDSMFSYLVMMGMRLLEMRRVLKPTGAIYLHCDDTAAHWLRVLMDAAFGSGSFRNEIVWKRIGNHNDAGRFGRTNDRLLYYGTTICRDAVRVPLDPANVASKYRHKDNRGRYRKDNLTGAGTREGFAGSTTWKGWNPTQSGRHWSVPYTGAYAKWIEANLITGYCSIASIRERLELLDKAGLIAFTSTGTPELKRYLSANPGQVPPDVWTDIPPVNSQAKERLGYPTQKPLKLLGRIISASCPPDGVVLDPFCGCATTCVAAETLGREWAGIDLSPLAVTLVGRRLREDHGVFGQIIARTDIPHRTDQGKPAPYRTHRHVLYGEQEGHCNGCRIHFPFRNLTVDHVVPRSKGGSDHRENLQLLCGACNSLKGTGGHTELLAKLVRK